MLQTYVFIDESGDLGRFGTRFFVMVAVEVADPAPLSRIMKRLRERKLKKSVRTIPELKAAKTPPPIRKLVLELIAKVDCKIRAVIVEKAKTPDSALTNQNRIYNALCGMLCHDLEGSVHIVIDKKYTEAASRRELDEYLKTVLNTRGIDATVQHAESHSSTPLQAVDFVAWAIKRKYSHGEDQYYKIIGCKIVEERVVTGFE